MRLLCLLSLTVSTLLAGAETPNFVIISIDDLGYADIGPFGSKLNRTPNLDRMAQEGMRLTSFYGAPVCTPSRASLMTGCYPKRVSLPNPRSTNVLFPGDDMGLNPEEHTLPELLKERGYSTMCIGKWHLGDQPEFLPTRHGFDHYLGIPYSNDMGPLAEGARSDWGQPLVGPNVKATKKGPGHPPLPLLRDEKVILRVKAEEQTTLVTRYTEEAVKYLHSVKDKPFFLYLPHNAVHFPTYPGDAFRGKSPHGLYSDWVEEMDWGVGQVLNTLRELGLDKNTLVIFTSDNGGTPRGLNTPLRGNKASTWEGGVRVCTLAWWPGKIPAGSSSDITASMMELLPTFVKLAGGTVPADRKIDGVDIWPALSGKADAPGRESFCYFKSLQLEAVRQSKWKLDTKGGRTALYDLEADIGETTDVSSTYPAIVKQLEKLMDDMDADLGKTGTGPGCRPCGKVEKAEPLIGLDGTVREGFTP